MNRDKNYNKTYMSEWHATHKIEEAIYARNYRKTHIKEREAYRIKHRKESLIWKHNYNINPVNRKHHTEASRQWRKENIGKVKAIKRKCYIKRDKAIELLELSWRLKCLKGISKQSKKWDEVIQLCNLYIKTKNHIRKEKRWLKT